MNEHLETLLLQFSEVAEMDLRGRLLWLEALSLAASDPENDFGEEGERAALDLRAALGAIIAFAHSAQTEVDRVAMEMTVKGLLVRATAALFGVLSRSYKQLAESGLHAADCRLLSRLFKDVQRAVERGDPIPPPTLRKFQELRDRVT